MTLTDFSLLRTRGTGETLEFWSTVFAEINAHPEISAHQNDEFSKGGVHKTDWIVMDDFSKGGVHKTDWIVMGDFSKGGVHKTDWIVMDDFSKGGVHKTDWIVMGDFSKGGVHETDGFWWVSGIFLLLLKIKRPGRYFGKYGM